MTIAILPLRALHDGKRRLAGVLSPGERTALVQGMLLRVVRAVQTSKRIERVIVVSPDAELLAWVQPMAVWPIEQPAGSLNAGLEYARSVVRAQAPRADLLVVLPDLPQLQPLDIVGIVAAGTPGTVVVAPDRHQQGTNALWLPPDAGLPFSFGPDSLRQHLLAAERLGLRVQQYHARGSAFDLDTAEDLKLVRMPAGGSDT